MWRNLSRLVLVVALLIPLDHLPSVVSTADPFALSSLKWSHRPLLVFASSAQAESYQKQMQLLEPEPIRTGLVDRDMVVLHLFGEGESYLARPVLDGETRTQPLAAEDVAALRDHFDVPSDAFAAILVGKDGTEKRRDRAAVRPEHLFTTIDAMPMRQREMRGGNDGER